MKLVYFKPVVPLHDDPPWVFFPDGAWRDAIHPQRCTRLIPQKGLTKDGKKKRARWCLNSATHAMWWGGDDPIHRWTDPLCTQHFKKRASSPASTDVPTPPTKES